MATIIGETGAQAADTEESFWHHATGGLIPPPDLRTGQALLFDLGLIIERDGRVAVTAELEALLGEPSEAAVAALALRATTIAPGAAWEPVPEQLDELVVDPQRREELLLALGRRFDDACRRELGAAGEELVAAAAREQLAALGHVALAGEVARVSLFSDQLGYDVVAPRVQGARRLLEVKSVFGGAGPLRVFLSRGEVRAGTRFDGWFLVVCAFDDADMTGGRVVGWTTMASLEPLEGLSERGYVPLISNLSVVSPTMGGHGGAVEIRDR